jgi:hypothetical protein
VCRTFDLIPLRLFLSKTNVNSVYLIASIIIRHSVFCTIRFTFSRFHIIFSPDPFPSSMLLSSLTSSDSINARIRSEFSALLRYKDRRKLTPRNNKGGGALSVRHKLPNTSKKIRFGTRNTHHRLLRINIGSYADVRDSIYL